MATDYDAPRHADADLQGEPALQALASAQSSGAADPGGDVDPVEGEVALAAADLTDKELAVPLVPRQFDEFICTACHLVHHKRARPQRVAEHQCRTADPQGGWQRRRR